MEPFGKLFLLWNNLLEHLEQLKSRTPQSERRLWECVNNAWSKMTKYYELTDKSHQIYAVATFLNPTQRRDFSDNAWVGELQPWIEVMLANYRGTWEREYAHLAPQRKIKKRDAFEEWLYRKKDDVSAGDEFSKYSTAGSANPLTERFDPIAWWSLPDVRESFPTLHRCALDILACPVTSCERERAFGSAKKLIAPERNLLGDDVIEALECLRAWWNNGLVKRP
jgi:hAT family C-terminal dimerisation region